MDLTKRLCHPWPPANVPLTGQSDGRWNAIGPVAGPWPGVTPLKSRIANAWQKLRTSLWVVPLLMTGAAGLLAWLTTSLDRRLPRIHGYGWLWWGEPSGARDILTTVAGSMITVAGVTFSITIVAMTLAASQFGPRLLRNFMRDTGNQVVLGTFVATFLYCLLVLGAIEESSGARYVPQLSITVALVLAVAGLGVLIYFVHHVSVSLQSEYLAASTASEMAGVIRALFPERLGKAPDEDELSETEEFDELRYRPVRSPRSGYLQSIDNTGLLELAEEHDVIVSLPIAPGEFVIAGSVLARISPPERCTDKLAKRLADMFLLGRYRTPTQDAKYPFQQLTVIAVRALSPGINDPFTAITCIDWIGSGLSQLAQRQIPSAYRKGDSGKVRIIAQPTTFSALADVALNPVRQSGAGHIAVMLRLLETIDAVAQRTVRKEDRESLQQHADRVLQEVNDSAHQKRDKDIVRKMHDAVTNNLRRSTEPEDRGAAPPSDRG